MGGPVSELHGLVPNRYGMPRAAGDRSTMAQLARQTVALVLAGGRGSRLGRSRNGAPSRPCPSAASSASSTSRSPIASTPASGASASRRSTNPHGLIHHLQRGWSFLDGRFNEFIELLPAQQSSNTDWYKGTADAVYQNLEVLRRHDPRLVLVLAGDHIYKMDYTRMLYEHVDRGADMTVGCVEVPVEEAASQLGVMEVDDNSACWASRRSRRCRARSPAIARARSAAWASTSSTPTSSTTSCSTTRSTRSRRTTSATTSFRSSSATRAASTRTGCATAAPS